jgi:hypothetical protein
LNQSKYCSKCKQVKSLADFHKSSSTRDGLQYKCKPCHTGEIRAWEKKNPEKVLAYKESNKLWRIRNAESIKAKGIEYAKQHRAEAKNRVAKRRAELKSNGVFLITAKEVAQLYIKPCFYCGSHDQIELDHVIPISRSGTHSIGNLVAACRLCNRAKSNLFVMEWQLGRKTKRKSL